jgi:hypothetical protein
MASSGEELNTPQASVKLLSLFPIAGDDLTEKK